MTSLKAVLAAGADRGDPEIPSRTMKTFFKQPDWRNLEYDYNN